MKRKMKSRRWDIPPRATATLNCKTNNLFFQLAEESYEEAVVT